ncbi:AAA family ATPase [Cobetia sp. 14N.309.X.WAT.E.A4]|uniref:AAA family ATPase n=1 Tax=Cobetia sp. 14N.309.X.WAT.E.A4 TaxID=2998323 RepID=UPI0025AEE0E9|nr:ATP-binding protein [Cobetia sp. 14N.309.X.WAT.E.A4]MDN2657683.1 AAA family ATPase [Cobetia sp. 14N.309.X.WAT.E.A4]
MYIHSIEFNNFYSFYEETSLDFTTSFAKSTQTTDHICGRYVNKVNGIFGANGSGKTNVLKAISFMCFFARGSFDSKDKGRIPFNTHELHEGEPSNFKLEFSHLGNLFKYTFTVQNGFLNKEALYYQNPKTNKFKYLYKRELIEDTIYTKLSAGKEVPERYNRFNKNNCSLLSFIAEVEDLDLLHQKNNLIWSAIQAFDLHFTNVGPRGKLDDTDDLLFDISEKLAENENTILFKLMQEVVRNIDLGISALTIGVVKVRINDEFRDKELLYAKHVDSSGKEYSFPILEESTGTQKIICALWHMIRAMIQGGVVVYDEIDSDLHILMMPFFIDIFTNHELNVKPGQLIYSGHAIDSIKELSKSQTFFVEKIDLRSEIYSADEIEGLRTNENIYMKYKKGALGGVPELDASNISLQNLMDSSLMGDK